MPTFRFFFNELGRFQMKLLPGPKLIGSKSRSKFLALKAWCTSPNLGFRTTMRAASRSTCSGTKKNRLIRSRSFLAVARLPMMPAAAFLVSLAKSTGMMPERNSSSKYSISRSHCHSRIVGMLSLHR